MMKKIALVILMFLVVKSSRAQLTSSNLSPDEMVIFSYGINNAFINTQAFDQWTAANYGFREKHRLNSFLGLDIIGGRFQLGLNAGITLPYETGTVYFGRRLTGPDSKISSWLNIEYGRLTGIFSNIAPPGYIPAPDQEGKKPELRYKVGYVGLSSKNYLNFMHFNTRIGGLKIPFNPGVNVEIGYAPSAGEWRYGYANGAAFKSDKVYTIPKPGNVFVNTGLFMGF
jgi:hypothetical protein